MIHNIPQPAFEEFVAHRLAQDGGVEIRKNHSFVSCEQVSNLVMFYYQHLPELQKGDRVVTMIENRNSQTNYEICSRHVVACDGARSKVRETLGIECEGESTCKLSPLGMP